MITEILYVRIDVLNPYRRARFGWPRQTLDTRRIAKNQPQRTSNSGMLLGNQRLPERGLLDILARTAHLVGWPRHFGPVSGSDPKIRDAMARYVLTVFANGTLLGPAQVARHMRDHVSARMSCRSRRTSTPPAPRSTPRPPT